MADTDLIERLTGWFTDWNGERMVPGEPPRDGIHCDILMEAATALAEKDARIAELETENKELDFLLHEGGTWEEQLSKAERERDEARAECERLRAALERIADAPAWGAPHKWEVTPSEVRHLARDALEAAPSPSPAPEVVEATDALQVALDLLQEKIYGNPARSPGHNAQHYIKRALASLAQGGDGGVE